MFAPHIPPLSGPIARPVPTLAYSPYAPYTTVRSFFRPTFTTSKAYDATDPQAVAPRGVCVRSRDLSRLHRRAGAKQHHPRRRCARRRCTGGRCAGHGAKCGHRRGHPRGHQSVRRVPGAGSLLRAVHRQREGARLPAAHGHGQPHARSARASRIRHGEGRRRTRCPDRDGGTGEAGRSAAHVSKRAGYEGRNREPAVQRPRHHEPGRHRAGYQNVFRPIGTLAALRRRRTRPSFLQRLHGRRGNEESLQRQHRRTRPDRFAAAAGRARQLPRVPQSVRRRIHAGRFLRDQRGKQARYEPVERLGVRIPAEQIDAGQERVSGRGAELRTRPAGLQHRRPDQEGQTVPRHEL